MAGARGAGGQPNTAAIARCSSNKGRNMMRGFYLSAAVSAFALVAVDAAQAQTVSQADTAQAQPIDGAQDAATAPQDSGGDIVVTGIRHSLERAADIKRDSVQVVDAIVATDIG